MFQDKNLRMLYGSLFVFILFILFCFYSGVKIEAIEIIGCLSFPLVMFFLLFGASEKRGYYTFTASVFLLIALQYAAMQRIRNDAFAPKTIAQTMATLEREPLPLLANYAYEANKICPKIIDSFTRIDSIKSDAMMNTLSCYYTFLPSAKLTLQTKKASGVLTQAFVKQVRNTPALKQLSDNGVSFHHIYRDEKKVVLVEVNIDSGLVNSQHYR